MKKLLCIIFVFLMLASSSCSKSIIKNDNAEKSNTPDKNDTFTNENVPLEVCYNVMDAYWRSYSDAQKLVDAADIVVVAKVINI